MYRPRQKSGPQEQVQTTDARPDQDQDRGNKIKAKTSLNNFLVLYCIVLLYSALLFV